MIETLKRHLFLVSLAAGVLLIALAVGLLAYFFGMAPKAEKFQRLRSTARRAEALLPEDVPIYNADLVDQMAEQVEQRKKLYEDLLTYLRTLGAARKPLVEGLFPTSTDVSLRHSFKSAYDARLDEFMQQLNATMPVLPPTSGLSEEAARARIEAAKQEARTYTMYTHPRRAFSRPDWVDKQTPPSLAEARNGQEDIWLMEDLVGILAKMNADILAEKGAEPVVANAPLKELIEIGIGGKFAVLPDTGMTSISGRYRPVEATSGAERLATFSGRVSMPDFYKILPWRLRVVVEARYAGELLRRLRGTESFLSVEAYHIQPVTYSAFERAHDDLLAFRREDYGDAGVVRLQVVGESLIFELEGGRITTLPGDAAEDAAEDAA